MADIVPHPASPQHPAHVTTRVQIARDLKASLIALGVAKPVGTTWGDFKVAMVALGVKDSDALASIEHGVKARGSGYLLTEDNGDGIEVREL